MRRSVIGETSTRPIITVPNGYILVNDKWRGTEVANGLQGQVKVLYEDDLGVVDFHPSASIGVIYITEADLVASSGMCRNKLVKLRMMKTMKGVVLVEKTDMTKEHFGSFQKFTVLELGLTLLPVATQKEAADMLAALVRVENEPDANPFRRSRRRSAPFMDDAILSSLMCVPGLGEVKARSLLRHFHSLQSIADASEKELSTVVGAAGAHQIKTFFCKPP